MGVSLRGSSSHSPGALGSENNYFFVNMGLTYLQELERRLGTSLKFHFKIG